MNENNKGSMIILTIIGIATLLIAVIGATFAYFTVTVKYNDKPKDVIIQSNTMVIEYDALNSISYEGAIPGRPSEETLNKMKFYVSSNQNMMLATKYDVYLKITKNEFVENETGYTNLMFYLNENVVGEPIPELLLNNPDAGIIGTRGNLFANKIEQYEFKGIEKNEADKITGIKNVGIIPFNTDPNSEDPNKKCPEEMLSEDKTACMLKISEGATVGNLGSKDEWYFEIWLKEIGDNQNYDQGKFFEASIEIVPAEEIITNEPDLVNP